MLTKLDWFYTCDPNLAICSDDLLYIPEETTVSKMMPAMFSNLANSEFNFSTYYFILYGNHNKSIINSFLNITFLQKIDEKSDELADQAFDSVKTSVSSAWKFAAGYTSQMFKEEDLEAEALLVREGKFFLIFPAVQFHENLK